MKRFSAEYVKQCRYEYILQIKYYRYDKIGSGTSGLCIIV